MILFIQIQVQLKKKSSTIIDKSKPVSPTNWSGIMISCLFWMFLKKKDCDYMHGFCHFHVGMWCEEEDDPNQDIKNIMTILIIRPIRWQKYWQGCVRQLLQKLTSSRSSYLPHLLQQHYLIMPTFLTLSNNYCQTTSCSFLLNFIITFTTINNISSKLIFLLF